MTTTKIDNPYLEAVRPYVARGHGYWSGRPRGVINGFMKRDQMVRRYAFTVPDDDALQVIAKHSPDGLIDPLAGTGYWGSLLSQMGVKVKLTDYALPGEGNEYHQDRFAAIECMDAVDAVTIYNDYDTLLLSWVPNGDDIGERVLAKFSGSTVITIGENRGGCCGTDGMFFMLAKDWTLVESQVPLQWYGLHDVIEVFRRK